MLLLLFLFGVAISAPTDEFRELIFDGELSFDDATQKMAIVPSGYSPQKLQKPVTIPLEDVFDSDNDQFQLFRKYTNKGSTFKGLTFNIYDDDMREAAVALFRFIKSSEEDISKFLEWANQNVNKDLLDYVGRLISLYTEKDSKETQPPSVTRPNFFVNAETITKALRLKINNGNFSPNEANVNQFYRTDDVITINTNYSSWNIRENGCDGKINYLIEDVGLNNYYYGIHLLHPFWMTDKELNEINPRYAESYYFTHRQLLSRYLLEKQHLGNCDFEISFCNKDYYPDLVYKNGLSFPPRTGVVEWNDDTARLKGIQIAIKEFLSRGFVISENGDAVNITEENYTNVLAKFLRQNMDNSKTAKIIRRMYGSDLVALSTNEYNPAPSTLHHPETTLRDPQYWYLISKVINYFTEYSNTFEPLDISKYVNEDFEITDHHFTKISTFFDHFELDINEAIEDNNYNYIKSPLTFTARQRRLNHFPFKLNFTVQSKSNNAGVIRLFLGPQCHMNECWNKFQYFYQLDEFLFDFIEGTNNLSWSPETSERYTTNKKNIFKFPNNLMIPRGLNEGLNLTLFVMISKTDRISKQSAPNIHQKISFGLDQFPLGFPFHRQLISSQDKFVNFKFHNISIFHKIRPRDNSGYFSSNLY